MPKIQIDRNSNISKFLVFLVISLIIGLEINFFWIRLGGLKLFKHNNKSTIISIQPVSAEEIYSMFVCPCCGNPLDPNNICCGMAQERIAFIDGLTAGKLSKDEVVMAYVKKYGLDSFVEKDQAEKFKKELAAKVPRKRPIIYFDSETADLGDVSVAEGEKSISFEITNIGKADLIIDKLDTSCGCTSATIVYHGKEGPRFAMAGHGIKSPTDWQVIIPPGEKAELKVYYNPNVHEDFRGAATREVYIFSNDPINFEKKVRIELNQVD